MNDDNQKSLTSGNFDLSNIPDVNPLISAPGGQANVNEPSRTMIGFQLSKYILLIIAGFILFLIIYVIFKKIDASHEIQIPQQTNISDSSFTNQVELIKIIQQEKKNQRDFIIELSQMILLNLLLPTLTAVLGYIFASNQSNNKNDY